jgi:class 3 adenylate cyclase
VFGGRLGEALLFALHPVRRGGAVVAVVAAGTSVGRPSALVDALSGGGEVRPFVLWGGDRVLAHPLLRLVPTGSRREPLAPVERFPDRALRELAAGTPLAGWVPAEQEGVRVVRARGTEGRSELVLFKEIAGFGERPWTVGLVVPEMLIHPVLMPLRLFALAAILIALVAVAAAVAIGRRLARPVVRVTAAVERVSTLELDALEPLPASRLAELDALARAFNAMLATLKAFATYVPKSLVQRLIRAGRPDAVPSRERDLAVMFTDIQGFTAIAESLPPAEVARLLNEHFALLARCVEEEGGTVDKYLGDGMLAFWGAPEKIKNRGLRACRTALAIRRALEADNARRRARGEPIFRLRVGIHRGPLVVGNIGAPGRLDYTVVGDTVNLAQRLMELARERLDAEKEVAIVASEAIAGEAETSFRFAEIGSLQPRGREHPVRAFELLGERWPVALEPAPALAAE